MPAETRNPTPSKLLAPGARVAVRSSYEGSWCSGYEIEEAVIDLDGVGGYRLRRSSDQTVLPVVFPFDEVIPAGQ